MLGHNTKKMLGHKKNFDFFKINFCASLRDHQESEKTVYEMKENV